MIRGRCWASVTTPLLTTVFMVTSGVRQSLEVSSSSLERREKLRCGNDSLICCFEKRKSGVDSLK